MKNRVFIAFFCAITLGATAFGTNSSEKKHMSVEEPDLSFDKILKDQQKQKGLWLAQIKFRQPGGRINTTNPNKVVERGMRIPLSNKGEVVILQYKPRFAKNPFKCTLLDTRGNVVKKDFTAEECNEDIFNDFWSIKEYQDRYSKYLFDEKD